MSAAAAPAAPRAALVLLAAGWLTLVAGSFVALPFPVALAALLAAVASGAWMAVLGRRWQSMLAVVAMAYWFGRPALETRSSPPGGTGTLVTLIAFAVLVLGGWWVGRRAAGE
ncbi:MAG: hypothetical protein IPJ04_06290 [Candidatus Eisenbacteria bacterium]|nr:hypothetical protein [Candidatus Eisenbacteria bacterium]